MLPGSLLKSHARLILLTLALIIAVSVCLFWPGNRARSTAERTRLTLRQQGFKTELADFDTSIPADLRAQLVVFNAAGRALADLMPSRSLDLMTPVATNGAVVLALVSQIPDHSETPAWPSLGRRLDTERELLDAVCFIAISEQAQASQGPPRSRAPELTFQEIQNQRSLAMALAMRTVLNLRDHDPDSAWTNLLALTRLATATQFQFGNLQNALRFGWVTIAQRATWEALQAGRWNDERLARLQSEWQAPDFFAGLTDTIAFTRANLLAACEGQREAPPPARPGMFQIANDLVLSTSRGWDELTSGWRHSRYRSHGSYADETTILLYYRDRELEIRRATNATTWLEMRSLPGVTNAPPLPTSRQFPTQIGFGGGRQSGTGQGTTSRFRQSLLSRAAEAETRRRLVITALALERYRLAHGNYPDSLDRLPGDLLPRVPIDFMDGNPLRYRRTEDHHFVLYSTGLDCVDDGGQMRPDPTQTGGPGRGLFRSEGPDLLWPRPATPAEIEAERNAR